jgi:hypothetical protein
MRTSSDTLQAKLDRWLTLLNLAASESQGSPSRVQAIIIFCKTFVPSDISEDDLLHYAQSLADDEVSEHIYFQDLFTFINEFLF